MSQAQVKPTIYDEPTDAELARWPGVTSTRTVRSKHYALLLTFNGVTRQVFYPCSPSDAYRGALNHLADVRRVLTELGATRTAEVKTAGPRRVRNRTQPGRVVITDRATGGPKRDPWAGLSAMQFVEPEVPQAVEVEQPKPWWRQLLAWAVSRTSPSSRSKRATREGIGQ